MQRGFIGEFGQPPVLAGVYCVGRTLAQNQQTRGHEHRESANRHIAPLSWGGRPFTVQHAGYEMPHKLEFDTVSLRPGFHARIASTIRFATAGWFSSRVSCA